MRTMKDSGIAWIGEIPEAWKIVRNKNAFVCNKELVGKKSALTQLLSLTTHGIKKKDINNAEGKLPESFDTYQFVKENDIVMCLFDLDCSAVFSGISPIDGMISPAYRVLSCKECMEPRYADYWFRYISDGRKFNHFAKNIRYTLSYEEFSALPLLLPKKVEQHRIADYLDRKCSLIDAIIARQQEVIEKLKAYKLSIITEAVTKGLNPHAPMKDSGVEWIGEIPEHWKIGKLCFFTVRIGDGLHGTPEFDDKGEYYFINGNNLGATYITIKENTKTVALSEYNKYFIALDENTLLISLNGTIGSVSQYHGEQIILGKSAGYIIIDSCRDLTLDYLRFYLQSKSVKTLFELSFAGTTINNLSLETLRNLPVCIMTSEEQLQISKVLDKKCLEIESTIQKKQILIERLAGYKKSLIYEVVTGKKEV